MQREMCLCARGLVPNHQCPAVSGDAGYLQPGRLSAGLLSAAFSVCSGLLSCGPRAAARDSQIEGPGWCWYKATHSHVFWTEGRRQKADGSIRAAVQS